MQIEKKECCNSIDLTIISYICKVDTPKTI